MLKCIKAIISFDLKISNRSARVPQPLGQSHLGLQKSHVDNFENKLSQDV